MWLIQFLILSIILSIIRRYSNCLPGLQSDITNNASAFENTKLQKLRGALADVTTEDYETCDEFLLRWLKVSNFNLKIAEAMFRRAKIWRAKINLNETVHSQYTGAVIIDGVDYEGSPVVYGRRGKLDIRNEILLGHTERFLRFLYQHWEQSFMRSVEEWRKFPSQGFKQGFLVLDFKGFTVKQFGCWECLKMYQEALATFFQMYPFVMKSVVLINVPSSANLVLNTLTKLLPNDLLKELKIFGLNKDKWIKYLQSVVPTKNLLEEYGGARVVETEDEI